MNRWRARAAATIVPRYRVRRTTPGGDRVDTEALDSDPIPRINDAKILYVYRAANLDIFQLFKPNRGTSFFPWYAINYSNGISRKGKSFFSLLEVARLFEII